MVLNLFLIFRYATLLASQGCLTSALEYLGNTGSNPQLQELKDRLDNALSGHNTGHTAAAAQPARPGYMGQTQGQGSKPGSRRQSHQVKYTTAELSNYLLNNILVIYQLRVSFSSEIHWV